MKDSVTLLYYPMYSYLKLAHSDGEVSECIFVKKCVAIFCPKTCKRYCNSKVETYDWAETDVSARSFHHGTPIADCSF